MGHFAPWSALAGLALGEWLPLSFLAATTAAIALWEGRATLWRVLPWVSSLPPRGAQRSPGLISSET